MRNSARLRELFLDRDTGPGIAGYPAGQAHTGPPMIAIPASPLMHSTGFTFASLPTLTSGGHVVTLESRSFDPAELLATVGAVRAQVVAIVGDAFALPLVRALDAAPAGRYDTSSLLTLCSSGTAWSPASSSACWSICPRPRCWTSAGSTEGFTYGFRRVAAGKAGLPPPTFAAAPG